MHVVTLDSHHHGVTGEQRRLARRRDRWTLMPGGGNNVAQSTEHAKHTQETRMKQSRYGEIASQSKPPRSVGYWDWKTQAKILYSSISISKENEKDSSCAASHSFRASGLCVCSEHAIKTH